MPELPEVRGMCTLVNNVCSGKIFSKITKSEVTKHPLVKPPGTSFTISATARGKEMKLLLTAAKKAKTTHVLFGLGMSGWWEYKPVTEMHKHAHLRFHCTQDKEEYTLSYVDARRFGKWEEVDDADTWGDDRGPDPITEHAEFRKLVLGNLKKKLFDKPICEVLLDQRYFNGMGNYLRAEILHRCDVQPFSSAREALKDLPLEQDNKDETKDKDVLLACKDVCTEVIQLGLSKYPAFSHKSSLEELPEEEQNELGSTLQEQFRNWLQVYSQPDAKWVVWPAGRRIWFQGEPGPLLPTKAKSGVGTKDGEKPSINIGGNYVAEGTGASRKLSKKRSSGSSTLTTDSQQDGTSSSSSSSSSSGEEEAKPVERQTSRVTKRRRTASQK
eukprot:TRINITY_DN74769_c0_g1_i1.p1 TRINITY_DN74769_c0_g1~~TRINITY_DN74769_c0_g1_i1.p1  ORF type:complete len:405 (+),score=60.63 TRINITY_DN74769_c0_g1_i1:63-1217(+)